ncbi:SRPBCC family protein [Marinibacterium sp. SX1]|uniref:SRPBCC family protein n=1 Tax=Marinibacterium sp. SX1 TaxID=3388424 RepID=UPI003D163AE2
MQDMRFSALAAWVMGLALCAGTAEAHGPTPQKVDRQIDINAPCELVWSTLLDFGDIGGWHPDVTAVEATGAAERGSKRSLTLTNGESLTEMLVTMDRGAQSLSYRLARENIHALPVSFYTAQMTLERTGTAGRVCTVDWSARLYRADTTNSPPEEFNDEAAITAISAFFDDGLAGLKEAVE